MRTILGDSDRFCTCSVSELVTTKLFLQTEISGFYLPFRIQTLPRDLYNIGCVSFFQFELEKLHKDDLTSLKKEKSSEEAAKEQFRTGMCKT